LIVLDASAAIELLLGTPRAEALATRLLDADERLHAPHLFDIEVTQALRRLAQLRQISTVRAQEALDDAALLTIERHPHTDLLPRIWSLRNALSAYDAAYIALAEALDAPLITCDAKLAKSQGHGAAIELIT
jgi:predicted nucleic acid-binding protein